ncbi:MAG TPA: glycosyltransferase [Phycisphaerae bacterium]|nr:glycosyltransferase [Phycisphaerae bacterium]HRY70131.1 glycosyltransferase [Phycisphaerae bacterium]HSA28271.1 glycosyltransferase [Phycisphaerae bacterium]
MISIVVPAHNEETVIARCLRALVTGAAADEVEVIVACNGCTDRTAEIARSFGPPVHVIEVGRASKVAALNAADEVAGGFPRFYVDADVVLDVESVRRMADILERGPALFATPALRMDLSQTTWPVRAFYQFWTRLPYNVKYGQVGTGVYALSETGRKRFGRFPDIIADDAFVRFTFHPHERVRVAEAVSWVDPPGTLPNLIQIKVRSRLGGYQLAQVAGVNNCADPKTASETLAFLVHHPSLLVCLPWYVGVNLLVRWKASRQLANRQAVVWVRDDSRDRFRAGGT